MTASRILLVAPLPLPQLERQIAQCHGPPIVVSDFGGVAPVLARRMRVAGLVLLAGPSAAHRRSALRALCALRDSDSILPLALAVDRPDVRVIRAATQHRATTLLLPSRRAEVRQFAQRTARTPLRETLAQATEAFLEGCGLRPGSRPGQVLELRLRARTPPEVCLELGICAETYRKHVAALTAASGIPRLADILSSLMRRAETESWLGPVPRALLDTSPPRAREAAAQSQSQKQIRVYLPQSG